MAAVEEQHDGDSGPKAENERWPLLPDTELYLENNYALPAERVVRAEPWLRRSAIASMTDIDELRRVIQCELRFENPRQEIVAMCNQQIARVQAEGMGGDD